MLTPSDQRHFSRLQQFAFIPNSIDQPTAFGFRQPAIDPDLIIFGNLMPGMDQRMGELSVVRQDQQALAVTIQPAHGEQALFRIGHKVPEGPAFAGILTGTQNIPGFVEKQVFQRFCLERTPVKKNLIVRGIDAMPLRRMRMAIDLDPALGDELFTGPPGPHSTLR
jgi:hypothetical protein